MRLFRRDRSQRRRKIWLAVLATAAGTAVLTGLVLWVHAARNTDFGDPTKGITSTDADATEIKSLAGFRDLARRLGVEASPLRFRDVARPMGVVMRHGPGPRHRTLPEDTGSGLAWGDYDGDGDFDLYVVNYTARPGEASPEEGRSRLFRNDGNHFSDVTDQAKAGNDGGFGMGAAWGDYDGDGRMDLYVTNYGPNRLYRNLGNGTFEDVSVRAGVADPSWSTGATWGDFDGDGRLDLYVCNYVDYEGAEQSPASTLHRGLQAYSVPFALNPNSFDPVPNRLYRNRGNGTFEEVAERFGVSDPDGRSFAASFCDFDGDGRPDLFVANDVSPNRLYLNLRGDSRMFDLPERRERGEQGYSDVSVFTGTADTRGSMGVSIAELGAMIGQPDGLPDIFITHWVAQENALYLSFPISEEAYEYNDKTRQFRVGEISVDKVGWGCGFADFDLDGRPDLVVANGSTLEDKSDTSRLIPEPIFLFWNDGKQFRNVAAIAGEDLQRDYGARGLAIADFDDDGLVDTAISVNRGQPLLLHNETKTDNRGLKIRLKGPAAVCCGAKVEVLAGTRRQTQWWGADVSVMSMHAAELIFGLGKAPTADRVHVVWADGRQTSVESVPAGKIEMAYPGLGSSR